MVRWWWFGPAVTPAGLDREMEAMKAGGWGGFEVQPVYPLALDNPAAGFRNLPFLSPEFLDALRHTAGKARELGLRFDLTLGSGWPYGGPSIPVTQAAGRLRVVKASRKPGQAAIPVPDLGHGETLIAAFSGGRQLPDPRKVEADEAVFFVASRTGMMVKRPSAGAEGFVLDHYDSAALATHLHATGDPLLSAVRDSMPEAIFCDSLEVFGSDWTGALPEAFRKRRGYDLMPLLPLLLEESRDPRAAGVRYDWGRTLTELLEEHFLAPLDRYAKAHATKLRIQNYGIPPATLSSNRYGDISEGEGVDWKEVRAARWAASANHHFGRKVTSSETFTWLHSPAFRATPLDIKAEADIHFLQGVNQIIAHGWPYNGDGAEWPGWRFYAAGAFHDKNPWWIVMPDVAGYLHRMSWLLRQGEPVADVALYLPNADAWSGFTAGRVHMIEALREQVGKTVMDQILTAGFGVDFVDDGTLASLPRFRALVLPDVEYLPLESLKAIEKFHQEGGRIVATGRLPGRAPGLRATAADHERVSSVLRRIAGAAVAESSLGAALAQRLTPDLQISPSAPDAGFVHRRTSEADIYFLANTSNQPKTWTVTFRDARGRAGAIWNPLSGRMEGGARAEQQVIHLDPYGSTVVVFGAGEAPPDLPPATVERIDLSQGWTLQFPGEPPRQSGLGSWTADPARIYYSGTAVYERDWTFAKRPARAELDFGEGHALTPEVRKNGMRAWYEPPVREAAVVFVNGARAGALWCPPYRLEISRHLRAGVNRIRIVTANTAMNHMAGHPQPDYRLLHLRYGVRFEPQDMSQVQPLPSGLTGSISLLVTAVSRAVPNSAAVPATRSTVRIP